MPSITSTTATNFPLVAYPAQRLSERRLAALSAFERRMMSAVAPVPDEVFRTFIQEFTSMGCRDSALDGLARGGGKRISLLAAAQSHIASYTAGQAYLLRDPDRRFDASRYLLDQLGSEARRAMLANPALSESGRVVLCFPNSCLRLALDATCFGTGDGAITSEEALALLQTRDDTLQTLIGRLVTLMPDNPGDLTGKQNFRDWRALLEAAQVACHRDKDHGADGGFDTFDIDADLASGFLHLSKMADCQDDAKRMLVACARQHTDSGLPRKAAQAWRHLGEFLETWRTDTGLQEPAPRAWQASLSSASKVVGRAVAGEAGAGIGACRELREQLRRETADAFLQAAGLLLECGETEDVRGCLDRARILFDGAMTSANWLSAAHIGATLYEQYRTAGWPEEARAIARQLIAPHHVMGDGDETRKWERRAISVE